MKKSVLENKRVSSQKEESPDSEKGMPSAWRFEVRGVVSWRWLIPLVFVLLALLYSHKTYISPAEKQTWQHLQDNNSGGDFSPTNPLQDQEKKTVDIPERKADTPDYASDLRDAFELWFPLITVFLTASVLAKEGRWGTITQLTLRRPLWRVLFERLAYVYVYVYLYLLGVLLCGAVLTLLFTQEPPEQGNVWLWLWDAISTVLPTKIFLCAFTLFIIHCTGSVAAGYVLTVGYWVANYLYVALPQIDKSGDGVLYTLFGCKYHSLAANPDNWLWVKLVFFLLAILLFLVQFPILRQEMRLVRKFHSNE
jgi:hypothetical protein